jgi:hypothetical protein
VPKAAKTETKKSDALSKKELATFIANVGKKGSPRNGRRINFHFVRRKRSAY